MRTSLHPSPRSGTLGNRSRSLGVGRLVVAALGLVLVGATGAAGAAEAVIPGPPHLDLGIAAGSAGADATLEDYGWRRDPRVVWGLEVSAGWSRVDAGLRAEISGERSHLSADPGVELPGLRISGITAVGRLIGLRVLGAEAFALGSLGRAHLAFQPERATVRPPGFSEGIEVRFPSEWKWTTGVGAGLRRELGRSAVLALEGERSWFALETAHRRGEEIAEEREVLGTWNLRVRLSWRLRSL